MTRKEIIVACQTKVVARCKFGSIQSCSCGTMHVRCGNASMALPREAFVSFARMVDDAFATVAHEEIGRDGTVPDPDDRSNNSG